MSEGKSAGSESAHEIVITRVLDAARDIVWQAWTEVDHMAAWYGPEGFSTRVEENDFRPGGHWRFVMIGPDGTEYPSVGVYSEIVHEQRIVSTDEFGEGFEAAQTDLPRISEVTCLFEAMGAKTRLTIRIRHPSADDKAKHEAMGVVGGWNSSLDCLERHLLTLA